MKTSCDSAKLKALNGNIDKGFWSLVVTHSKSSGDVCEGIPFGYSHIAAIAREQGTYPEFAEVQARTEGLIRYFRGVRAKSGGVWTPNMNEYRALERYAADTWVLEQLLASHGIRTKGLDASRVEKFFATSASAALFPAFLETQIYAGILAASLLPALAATETAVTAHQVEAAYLTDVESDRQTAEIGEGAAPPKKKITIGDHAIYLKKFGLTLLASYETMRLQTADAVGLAVQRAYMQMGIDETDLAIQTIIAGDGNSNALSATSPDTDDSLDYDDLIKLGLAFPIGYQGSLGIVKDGGSTPNYGIRNLLNMAEFKDPQAAGVPTRAGVLNPTQIDWRRWTSTGAASFASDCILEVDPRYALAILREGGLMQETDKLIDNQFNRIVVTTWTGIQKVDTNAAQMLNCAA